MIYVLLYTLIGYLNITMVYTIILDKKMRKQKWIFVASIMVTCLIQCFILKKTESVWMNTIYIICGLSIPILWLKEKKVQNILLYPVVCIGIFFANKLGEFFINIIHSYLYMYILQGTLEVHITETVWSSLLLKFVSIFVILAIYLVKLKREQPSRPWIMLLRQFILVLFGFVSFSIVVVFTRMLGESLIGESIEEENTAFYMVEGRASSLLLITTCLIFIILCIWQILTLRKEEEYRWKNEAYENYMKMQEDSIHRMIEKDQSMRKFRHDLHAHTVVLEEISKRIGDPQLQEYIAKMRKNSIDYTVKTYSGIAAVDAVVSEIAVRAKKSHISIQWEGTLNGMKDIAVYDLCVIFSNLLTNAMEACQKLEEDLRIIYVKTYCFEKNIYINIGNSCKKKVLLEENGTIKTEKSDKRNHGFGTKNILDIVKKNEGSIKYITEPEWFEVKIVM